MNSQTLRQLITNEIKPDRCFLRGSALAINLNDRDYLDSRFKTIEEVVEALHGFTPKPYIPEEWDCDDQTIDIMAYLRRAGILAGFAISPAHSAKGVFSNGEPWKIDSHMFGVTICSGQLVVIEGKDKKVLTYAEAQVEQHNGIYNLKNGKEIRI